MTNNNTSVTRWVKNTFVAVTMTSEGWLYQLDSMHSYIELQMSLRGLSTNNFNPFIGTFWTADQYGDSYTGRW